MQQKLPENLFISGSVLLVTILIGGWIAVPIIVHNQVKSHFVLEQGTGLYEAWADDKQTTFTIYVFNVTNPEEIIAGGEPVVQELGPYVYNKILKRRIIQATTENDTILFRDVCTYHFNEELSHGKESDQLIVLNVPFVAVAQQLSALSAFRRSIALSFISDFKSEVFLRRNVGDYLFKGTFDPMVHELQELTGDVLLPNSTFALFYGFNETDFGLLEVDSGKNDLSRVGEMVSWKGETDLDFWYGPYCNMLNGTDSSVFPSSLSKDQPLYVFQHYLCRSVELRVTDEIDIRGVRVYSYETATNLLDAPKDCPNNRCYCSEEDVSKCFGAGVYSVKSCRNDAPVLLSLPHFLGGEATYAKKFGLHPNKSEHAWRLFIEPKSGSPLEVAYRVQINADVRKLSKIKEFKAIQNMIFPLAWVEEGYILPNELIAELQARMLTPLKLVDFAKWFVLGCSVLQIVISAIIFMIRSRKKSVFV